MSKLLQAVFKKRGYDENYLKQIEENKRTSLLDVDILIQKLHNLKQKQKKLVILPDFDMDGIMSGVIGFSGFAELGFNVELFIPTPSKGYGFNQEVIDDLIKAHPNVNAIITCDNGITAFEGVTYAKSKGIEVYITDHHKPAETYPMADVIVDPLRYEDNYILKGICGAHVLWHVLMQYVSKYAEKDIELMQKIWRLQIFAGIGTVSDIMPMLYENRELVRNAIAVCRLVLGNDDEENLFLKSLNTCCKPYQLAYYGLYNVLKTFQQSGKIKTVDDIDEEFFGFYLAPMFNSVKRLDADMAIAFKAFFSEQSMTYIAQLFQMNEQRKLLVNKYMTEICEQDNPYAPYVYITTASSGLVGLLASKLMEENHVPTFVVHKNEDGYGFVGSGRSPEWFSAHTILTKAGFHIAGHEGAFGCGFTDKQELKSLCALLGKLVPEAIKENLANQADVENGYDYIIDTDGVYGLSIDVFDFAEFLQELKALKPFGNSFEKPMGLLIIQKNAWSNFDLTVMGKMKQHVKLTLNQGLEVLLWNQAKYIDELKNKQVITIAGQLGHSEFLDKSTINFMGNVTDVDINNLQVKDDEKEFDFNI